MSDHLRCDQYHHLHCHHHHCHHHQHHQHHHSIQVLSAQLSISSTKACQTLEVVTKITMLIDIIITTVIIIINIILFRFSLPN